MRTRADASSPPLRGRFPDPSAITPAYSRHDEQSDTVGGAAPLLYALIGTVLLAIGGMLFVNVDEDPEIFMVFTVVFTAPGLYLLIAGAVARGVALART